MILKKEFIDYIAENYGITKKNASEIVDTFTDAFKKATIEDGGVNLTGFIKSEIKNHPERDALNPRTGEKIKISAKKSVKVTISPKFKNMEG